MQAYTKYLGAVIVLATAAGCDQIGQLGQLPPIEVRFSPKGGCTEMVVQQIDAARKSIYVQAYSFTSVPIAKALHDAHNRGVHVEVIFDRSEEKGNYTAASYIQDAGITTYIDARHPIAHNKVMIIDGQLLITGSFNFTKQAEEGNAENLLVIHDTGLASRYMANWQEHLAHSEHYQRGVAATTHATKTSSSRYSQAEPYQNRRNASSATGSRDSIPRF